jgi:HK97 family phage major capsid protein/HK97 family phage prohead protease
VSNRAYSIWNVKSDEEARTIEGFASTPELDRQGDSMDPAGAKFTLPLPLIWQHKADKPIGRVIAANVTDAGIYIKAKVSQGVLPYIEEAWALLKSGLVSGLSIDWRPLSPPTFKNGTSRYSSWELLGLSTVTLPANRSATIRLVKSIDAEYRAALGTGTGATSTPAGAPASKKAPAMTVSEQLTEAREALQQKSARLEELIASDEQGGGLEADEQAEVTTLSKEIGTMTSKVTRLATLEAAQAAGAASVTAFVPSHTKSNGGRTGRVEVVDHLKDLPVGTLFTRYAMAKAAGKGSFSDTMAYAKRWDAQTPEVSRFIKAEAGSTLTASPGWGSELAVQNNLANEFIGLVRPLTIVGRVEGFRTAPFNSSVPVQSGGSTVNWVGEGAKKPVTELEFTTKEIPNHKMAGIIVLTDELIRLSSPSAEALVRRDLTEQIAQFRDEQFIRVAVTAGANNPASITNGVTAPNASGTTLAALYADLKTALASFDTAGITTEGLVIATTPAVARTLSMMVTSLGMPPQGFNVNPNGGTLLGYPVIVSASVDTATLVIFKPSEIFLADDGRVTLDASNQATLDMGSGNTDFNLWQRNCTAVRAEQWITWVKRREGAVAIIDTIAYVPGT